MSGNPWMLPKVTDYWDSQTGAIETAATRLEALSSEARAAAIDSIGEAIERHFSVFDDDYAASIACLMVDDLYKTVSTIPYWDPTLRAYLGATASRACAVLATRDITLNYVVDNEYRSVFAQDSRPMAIFREWFDASGLFYICPQEAARYVMEQDGVPRDRFATAWPVYRDEAIVMVSHMVERCRDEHRHFVYLDADATDRSVEQAIAMRGQAGFVVALRVQPPVAGTNIQVFLPPGMRWPFE